MTRTHGKSHYLEYRTWVAMWQRVTARPGHEDYQTYVLRGVTVDPRWKSFEVFYIDVGPRLSMQHSLDRYPNPSGNYEPGNVRWATSQEQCNNKRNNHIVEHAGLRLTISEWSRRVGVHKDTLRRRIVKGWAVEKALSTPTRVWRRG